MFIELILAATLGADPEAKLKWEDFWTLAGVGRTATRDSIVGKRGRPDEERKAPSGDTTLRYKTGPTVTLRSDGAVQLDFGLFAKPFVTQHPSPPLALLDLPCAEAAKKLAFTKKIESYTTCKHYDASGYLLDVTLMCSGGRVSTLVVVWLPVPELKTMKPLPADHC